MRFCKKSFDFALSSENDHLANFFAFVLSNGPSFTSRMTASSDKHSKVWYVLGVNFIQNASEAFNAFLDKGLSICFSKISPFWLKAAIPIYGDGKQIRDWLYVEDHAEALFKVITEGEPSSTFNIGGFNEKTNIEVVHQICDYLDSKKLYKNLGIGSFRDQIKNIKDRPGHDVRYAIDSSKIKNELGWVPKQIFEVGLIKTIEWYLDNKWWWEKLIK